MVFARICVAGTVGWASVSLCAAAWADGPAAVGRAMQSATTTKPTTTAEGIEAQLLQAADALRGGKYAEALELLERLLEGSAASSAQADRAGELMSQALEAGRGQIVRARSLADEKKYIEADELLWRLVEAFAGTEVAEAAEAERDALRARPGAAAALQAADRERDAAGILARADELARDGQYAAAMERYELVVTLYGRSRAGQEARQKADYLLQNKQTGERIRQQRAEREAAAWLSIARSYARMGRVEEARRYYEQLIRAYPDTGYARTAREELEAIAP